MDQQRYKKRGLQFNSALDSRALRAVQYQERRKSRRNDFITHRRQMDQLEDSMDKGRPSRNLSTLAQEPDENLTKKTRKELGLERYKQLLKWKEQKRKNLEKEKKRRRPSFKTGAFQPDPPKFLVSGDVDMGKSVNETPGKATPFKFLVSSSKKYGATPGTSLRKNPVFHTGVTPGTSMHRIPKFHTGVTPNETLKKERILGSGICSKKEILDTKEEDFVSRRTRASSKRMAKYEQILTEAKKVVLDRTTRRRKAVERQADLGVKPLPATPQPTRAILQRERKIEPPQASEAHVSSFAPSDFDFNFAFSKVSRRCDFLPKDDNSSDTDFPTDAQRYRHSTRLHKSALDSDSSCYTSDNSVSESGKISNDPQLEVPMETENEVSESRVIIERDIEDDVNAIKTEMFSKSLTSKEEEEVDEECVTKEKAVRKSSETELKTTCAEDVNAIMTETFSESLARKEEEEVDEEHVTEEIVAKKSSETELKTSCAEDVNAIMTETFSESLARKEEEEVDEERVTEEIVAKKSSETELKTSCAEDVNAIMTETFSESLTSKEEEVDEEHVTEEIVAKKSSETELKNSCAEDINAIVTEIVTKSLTSKEEEEVDEENVTEENRVKKTPENELKTSCAGGHNDVEYVAVETFKINGNTEAEKEDIKVDEDMELIKENINQDEHTDFDSNVCDTHHDETDQKVSNESKRCRSLATPAKCHTRKSCCDGYVTPSMSRLRPRTPCSRNTRRSLSAHCDSPPKTITRSGKKVSSKSSRRSVNSVVKLNNFNKMLSETSDLKFNLTESEDADTGNIKEENELSIGSERQIDEEGKLHGDATTKAQEQFVTPVREETFKETKSELTTEPSELMNSSPLTITPRSHGRRSKVSWMIDASPWIDKSRRSANRKRSYGTPDFQKLSYDIPTDGSPVLAHQMPESVGLRKHDDSTVVDDGVCGDSPEGDMSKVFVDSTCTKILALLEPSSPVHHMDSPDIDVWSVVSPTMPSSASDPTAATPVTSKETIPHTLPTVTPSAQTTNKMFTPITPASSHKMPVPASAFSRKSPNLFSVELAVLDESSECKENEEPCHQNLQSNSILHDKGAAGKRKSRRSVMFTLKEQENDATPTFRFPGTPIRASSRVSMGLFGNVDVTTDSLYPWNQDLIDLDSPKSEKKTTATRKISRVSLLPGMKSSPIAVEESPGTQDLIRWDTPIEPKRNSRRSAVSGFATPSRRSRRLSKAPPL